MLSVVASAVTTGVTVVLARRVLPLAAAALAGVWMTFGYELVDHGTEARAYALLAMLAVLFAYTLQAAVADPTRNRLLALALTTAAGAYTHYFFFFTVAAGAAWLWAARNERAVRLRVTAAIAAGCATFLPWMPGFLHQLHSRPHGYLPRFDAATLTHIYSNIFAPADGPLHSGEAGRVAVLAIVVAGAGVLVRRGAALYAALATVPLALGAAAWAIGPRIWDARNLLEVAPFAAIAIAAAVDAVPWRPAAAVATAVLAAAALMFFVPLAQRNRTEWERFDADMAQMGWHDGVPVVLFGRYVDTVALSWYMPGSPRLHFGSVSSGCSVVFVVTAAPPGAAGRRRHGAAVRHEAAVPGYGRYEGSERRGPDLRIAELPWSPALARAAVAKGAMLLHTGAPGRPVCRRIAPKGV
jgi:hypothetical protein